MYKSLRVVNPRCGERRVVNPKYEQYLWMQFYHNGDEDASSQTRLFAVVRRCSLRNGTVRGTGVWKEYQQAVMHPSSITDKSRLRAEELRVFVLMNFRATSLRRNHPML